MRRIFFYLAFFCLLSLFSCKENSQEESHPAASEIALKWELVTNNYAGIGVFKSNLHFTNNSKKTLDNKNWELYFNHSPCRRILMDSLPASIRIIHINGDFFKIIPTDKFTPLKTGESFQLPVLSSDVAIKYTDMPGGFYFIFKNKNGEDEKPEIASDYTVMPLVQNETLRRSTEDILPVPTATTRYNDNLQLSLLPKEEIPLIIPSPLKSTYGKDIITITPSFEIHYQKNLKGEAEYLSEALKNLLGKSLKVSESDVSGKDIISLKTKTLSFSNSKEAYNLSVKKDDGIIINGNGNEGVFYGIQSLRAMLPVEAYAKKVNELSLKSVVVEDAPQLGYRGMLLDAVRHFHSKESILKLLELLSFYKMNVLHLHLGDDEGWRLEIQDLPELTEVSSKRGHTIDETDMLIPSYGCGPAGTLSPANGYYSRADFIEILKSAKQRHIEVIIAMDTPGHARAAIKAMDARYKKLMAKGDTDGANKYLLSEADDKSEYLSVQLFNDNVICPCNEGIYNFLTTVTGNVKEMYAEAGAPFSTIHIGADEVPEGVWEKSPACKKLISDNANIKTTNDIKKYFFERVAAIMNGQKLNTSVYEDAVVYKDEEKNILTIRKEFKNLNMKAYTWSNVWGWGTEDLAYKLANEGFPVILSHVTNLYFDQAYTNEPDEPGFYWGSFNDTRKVYEYSPLNIYNCAYTDRMGNTINPDMLKNKVRLTSAGKSNIIGMEGLLFSETLKSSDMMEYYTFPKLIGLAERAWVGQPKWGDIENREASLAMLNKNWNIFSNALGQRELPRMDYLAGGVSYRLAPPGAIIENGMLKINSSFPGSLVRYTTDGTEPEASSEIYTGPVNVSGTVKAKTFSSNGRSSRTSVVNYQ